tara:strand:- start:429 stop:686 length:258 start_codon:yes stop_codon:yes gene_type:complete
MKIFNFIVWLFDFGTMPNYNKRYLAYVALGIGGLFFTLYAPILTLFLMFIDLSVDILLGKWQEFTIETEEKKSKKTPPTRKMMME